ncbi:hypothetical protein G1K57_11085 [Tenacibaculum finnmarkense]|uniref:hypothetical protein n=1 Tax=Tenacibaculum finnmarkense TaxID=2781243 RepID=UPI001EFA41C3|nr:hypothetical protein [Tenacibaculum finnmarkense]MCG8808668.1 hypothetical protein [Tenacibaculum finnmarkense]MCG8818921.1 hypothetical protein [Tenacibaculum finnmarkense]
MNYFSAFVAFSASLILLTSCNSSSELKKDFTCKNDVFYQENTLKEHIVMPKEKKANIPIIF